MKKSLFQSVILTVICLFLTSSLVAQSPQGIPYQAVMRNSDGSVMASSALSLTFMIHDGTADGTVVYQESHSLNSNAQGLVSCVVGNGFVSQGNFSNINWGNGAKFLHVMMNDIDLGTQQMLSVPYALFGANVGVRVSATGDTLVIGSNIVIVPGVSILNSFVTNYNRTFYYFHGGAGPGYPSSSDLTATGSYSLPSGTTSSLTEVMTAMIDGTSSEGFFTQILSFELQNNMTLSQAGEMGFSWEYLPAPTFTISPGNTVQPNQYYYLAVPTNTESGWDNLYYPEDLTTSVLSDMRLQINGNKHQAASKKAFSYDGKGYMLYRLGISPSTQAWSVGFAP